MKSSTAEHLEVIAAKRELERVVIGAALQFKNLLGQRRGQALMNALRNKAPDLYEIISGTPEDCFYDDSKCPTTLAALGFEIYGKALYE